MAGGRYEFPVLCIGDLVTIDVIALQVYFVRGMLIQVPRLDRPIIHFSGGNGGDYARGGDKNRDDNLFRM